MPDTVSNFDDADELSGGVAHTDIDVDIIPVFLIEGIVSLPTGTAPVGGVDIDVIADDADTKTGMWTEVGGHYDLTIEQGESSVSFTIKIPASLPYDWIVRADCDGGTNCDPYTFFSNYNDEIGSTPIRTQATELTGGQNQSGVNFTLFEKYSGPPITCNTLLDEFLGAAMDMDDWYDMETERVLDTVADKLELSQKLISDEERSTFRQRFSADLAESPPKNTLEAQVALTEADLTATGTGTAQAGVGGTFYSKLSSPVVDDQTGDIYAQVLIGNRGAGIEAWWEIYESLNPSFTSSSLYADGTLTPPGGGWLMSTEYTAKIVYDGSNGFTFTMGTSNDSGSGPARMAASPQEFRRLVASVFPENNTDTDPISVRATFDDVKTDGVSYDNFNGVSELDQSKWDETQAKRVLTGGKLRVESRTQSSSQVNVRTRLNFDTYGDAECLQATLNLQNSSGFPSGTRGRARIEGVWYNALHNATSGYNGSEGNVWGQLSLDRRGDGTVRADMWMGQADDPGWTTETEIASFRFEGSDPLTLDTDYVATIMLDRPNKRMLYQFENEVFIVPILTKIYPVDPDEKYTALRTRVQDTASKLHVLFDDVRVSEADYDSDGMPNRTDDDDDGDGMPDTYEDDHDLNPLDEEDADVDGDNDGLTNKEEHDIDDVLLDPNNPDSDGDGVDDGRDMDPTASNNNCTPSTATFASVVSGPVMCGTGLPLSVDPPAEVQPSGHLWIAAPRVHFAPGFKSGRITVITGSDAGFPCAACAP